MRMYLENIQIPCPYYNYLMVTFMVNSQQFNTKILKAYDLDKGAITWRAFGRIFGNLIEYLFVQQCHLMVFYVGIILKDIY